jgi:hypothetical protein
MIQSQGFPVMSDGTIINASKFATDMPILEKSKTDKEM